MNGEDSAAVIVFARQLELKFQVLELRFDGFKLFADALGG